MIKIGLFIDTFYPMVDGVIEVVHNYATRLVASGFEVYVFCPRHDKKYVCDFPYKVVQCKGVRLFFIDYVLPLPKLDAKFRKILNGSRLDIVHIHSPFTVGAIGVRYAKKHNIPVIATMHSQFEQDFYRATHSKFITKRLLKKVMRVFNSCDEYYAVSPAVSEIFYRYGAGHKPPYMYSGTDMTPAENREELIERVNARFDLPADLPVYLFVGRITVLKNVFLLVEAMAKVKCGEFKLVIAGDGKDMPALRKKVTALGLDSKVLFLGRVNDRELLKALYCRAKLFLFPSMYDTNSLVQKEAASQGTPSLFIEGAATASNVTDGVNGFIAQPTPEGFAQKIEEIAGDDELYKKVCEGAKRDLYRTWDEAVDELKEVYYSLLKDKDGKKQP